MPGDSFSGSAKIANDYTSPVRLFFRMENVFPSDLGDEITLRIYRGTEKIYDGPLARNIKEMHIADMEPGTQWAFRYEIEVPSRLKNKYALTDAQVKWIFRAHTTSQRCEHGSAWKQRASFDCAGSDWSRDCGCACCS